MARLSRYSRFLRGSALIALVRIGGAGFGFLAQALLAHILGARDLGLFYAATSLAAVAGLLAAQGYPQIAARFAARYRREGRRDLFAAFVARATLDGATAALALGGLIAAASLAAPGLDPSTRACGAIAGLMVAATTCLTISTNLAGAIRLFGLCYVPECLVRPLAFLALVAGLGLAVPDVSGVLVTAVFAGLTIVVAAAQAGLMRRHLPAWRRPRPAERRLARRWRGEGRRLVLLSLYTNFFADLGILCVTPLLPKAEVAVFGLCLKLALLVGYVVQVTQQMAVPDFADARLSGDREAVRRIVRRAVVLPVGVTLAALAVVLAAGEPLLGLFGPDFRAGAPALAILVGSQAMRALAGPSAHLLTLTGAQGLNARLSLAALAVLVLATLVLAPTCGVAGAAGAVVLSYAAWIGGTALALARLGEPRTDALALMAPGPEPRPA
ncbi:hypothetical protein OPKNFCMD_3198 [Methylobacterium crusticola]|uniref:Lipopolysaccharide biosynthesis protein n=1 Tax=Methylobacterium crusticola TaxID=1697972 RepID=A0ABQ4QZ51_9HYPH|nr:oligosaccharide flippase family protein [Methylobacterium crusticola]GJD50459.1 hypothetical protein OPKNFCMD_3198 [Methylobacterium crusticola]